MAYGTACASFNVEGFGSERLYELDRAEVDARVAELERDQPLLEGQRRPLFAPTTTSPPQGVSEVIGV